MDIFYSIVSFFTKGGYFMYPILIVAALAAAIAIERYVTLSRLLVKNRSAWNDLEPTINDGNFDKTREVAGKGETAIARLMLVGLA